MLKNKLVLLIVLAGFVTALSGCATGRKKTDMEMQGLRNQISVLQTQLQAKDEEINSLKESLNKAEEQSALEERTTGRMAMRETKSRPTVKQIQTALKNAGYYSGAIDGKMGRKTREAVRAFQRANNLTVNGKVGRQTWNLLKGYLDRKVK
ncbi:MAG: peptidoglycan-binding protein [Candidatus Omnitrophica bacterium]|nr:peptidoglycan-binding protein [Candidatus Omnitrophota bacterium]